MGTRKSKMRTNKVTLTIPQAAAFVLAFAAVGVYAIIQSLAAPAYSIKVVGTQPLHYGNSFTAAYTGKVNGGAPWAYASCVANGTTQLGTPNQGSYTPGGTIWSEYRDLNGSVGMGPFELTDPIQHLWTGGGADCKLQLMSINNSGKQTVLATTTFTVLP